MNTFADLMTFLPLIIAFLFLILYAATKYEIPTTYNEALMRGGEAGLGVFLTLCVQMIFQDASAPGAIDWQGSLAASIVVALFTVALGSTLVWRKQKRVRVR